MWDKKWILYYTPSINTPSISINDTKDELFENPLTPISNQKYKYNFEDKTPIPIEIQTPVISRNIEHISETPSTSTNIPLNAISNNLSIGNLNRNIPSTSSIDPIPLVGETLNHDDSRIHVSTYTQAQTNPPNANNDLDILKNFRKKIP